MGEVVDDFSDLKINDPIECFFPNLKWVAGVINRVSDRSIGVKLPIGSITVYEKDHGETWRTPAPKNPVRPMTDDQCAEVCGGIGTFSPNEICFDEMRRQIARYEKIRPSLEI